MIIGRNMRLRPAILDQLLRASGTSLRAKPGFDLLPKRTMPLAPQGGGPIFPRGKGGFFGGPPGGTGGGIFFINFFFSPKKKKKKRPFFFFCTRGPSVSPVLGLHHVVRKFVARELGVQPIVGLELSREPKIVGRNRL